MGMNCKQRPVASEGVGKVPRNRGCVLTSAKCGRRGKHSAWLYHPPWLLDTAQLSACSLCQERCHHLCRRQQHRRWQQQRRRQQQERAAAAAGVTRAFTWCCPGSRAGTRWQTWRTAHRPAWDGSQGAAKVWLFQPLQAGIACRQWWVRLSAQPPRHPGMLPIPAHAACIAHLVCEGVHHPIYWTWLTAAPSPPTSKPCGTHHPPCP